MKKSPKIQNNERLEIHILLGKNYSIRSIAKALGRSPNSISAEIKRNATRGTYEPVKARHKALVRRKYARYQGKKIRENRQLEEYIIRSLRAHWNPDEISGRMKAEKQPFYVSKTAIYEWLHSIYGQEYCKYLVSKRKYPKKRPATKTLKTMIPKRVSITERPSGATTRSQYRHCEGDTVVSGKKTGSKVALAVVYERKSRYAAAQKIPNLSPLSFNQAVTKIQESISMASLSLDNGIENRYHEQLDVPTFFCDPYASWQKGGVENINRMIRRYIPKGSNIDDYSQEEIDEILDVINKKPRKILGYKTAEEVALKGGVITSRVS